MLTPLRQATARVVGTKQLLRALAEQRVKVAFVAADADAFLTKRVTDHCLDHNVPCHTTASAKEIGAACGIDVQAAAAGVLR